MKVSISFASTEAIEKFLEDLTAQLDKGMEPSVDLFLDNDGSGVVAGRGSETLTLQLVDEGDEEFANPSASVSR
jgi:hypothetical protein